MTTRMTGTTGSRLAPMSEDEFAEAHGDGFTTVMGLAEYETKMETILVDLVASADLVDLDAKLRVSPLYSMPLHGEPRLGQAGTHWFGISYKGVGKTYLYGTVNTALQKSYMKDHAWQAYRDIAAFLAKIEKREAYRRNRGIEIDVFLKALLESAGLDVEAETARLIALFRQRDWPMKSYSYHKTARIGEETLHEIHPGSHQPIPILNRGAAIHDWSIVRLVERRLGRYTVFITFNDGRLSAKVEIAPGTFWSAGLVMMRETTMPDTVLTALKGRPLTDLVDNAIFAPMTMTGHNIIARDDGGKTTVVNIKRTHERVRALDPVIDVETADDTKKAGRTARKAA